MQSNDAMESGEAGKPGMPRTDSAAPDDQSGKKGHPFTDAIPKILGSASNNYKRTSNVAQENKESRPEDELSESVKVVESLKYQCYLCTSNGLYAPTVIDFKFAAQMNILHLQNEIAKSQIVKSQNPESILGEIPNDVPLSELKRLEDNLHRYCESQSRNRRLDKAICLIIRPCSYRDPRLRIHERSGVHPV